MKVKSLSIALILLLTLGPAAINIRAQSNHSLTWGVEVGEHFTYVLQRAYFASPSYKNVIDADFPFLQRLEEGQKAILSVESLDSIPAMINDSSQIPRSYCNMTRANDSAILSDSLINFVLPIGDWDFLNGMVNLTGFSGATLINTQTEWGTKGAGSFRTEDGSIVTISLEMRYEKENGTLNYLRERYSTAGAALIDIIFVNWHPGMLTMVSPGTGLGTILIISTGVVIGLIISFVVYTRYSRKKSLVQRLGE